LADGRLHRAEQARADLARYDKFMAQVRKGPNAYIAEGTGAAIERDEVLAWTAFAEGRQQDALNTMRSAADLQDKIGQQEVDIPAREMLADMLLAFGQPRQALAEYQVALRLSPNRLNGLYNAGRAAEASGNQAKAKFYYAALLKSTAAGAKSTRPELVHARSFVSSMQRAAMEKSAR
jgi:tetratricopeptide (TPR) repeat protein